MAVIVELIFSVVGLVFSVAGYIQALQSSGGSSWYRSIWLPVVISLTILIGAQILHKVDVNNATDDIVTHLKQNPGQSAHQIAATIFPKHSIDVINAALEALYEKGQLHAKLMNFNLPDNREVAVQVFATSKSALPQY